MRNFNSRTLRTNGHGMANGGLSSSASSSQQQPSVSQLLNTLGGVYRDPSRVDRDASALLRSSVGKHLKPNIGDLIINQSGAQQTTVLLLAGTIGMNYRGNVYQILVHIYLPPAYPLRPPIAFVRLGAPNMYLKENHAHVGQDGQVYLHYLHEWRSHSHNLIELVVAMSSVFSNDPPVFTKRQTSEAAAVQASVVQSQTTPAPPSYDDSIQDAITASMQQAEIDEQRRLERQREEEQQARDARERAEAEAAAKRAEEEEQARTAQEAYDAQALAKTRENVRIKMVHHLEQCARDTKVSIQNDMRDQRRLSNGTDILNSQLAQLESLKETLKSQIESVNVATKDIEEWLQEANASESNADQEKEIQIDDLCKPTTPVYNQMLELSAENASLTDALYFLDKALARGNVDLTTHLKYVRKLSKQQFMIRAHLVKIGQLLKERRYN